MLVVNVDDEAGAIEDVVTRMTARFPDTPPESVRAIVQASCEQFRDRPIRDFVPLLVERTARTRLVGGADS